MSVWKVNGKPIVTCTSTENEIIELKAQIESLTSQLDKAVELLEHMTEWDGILPHSMVRIKSVLDALKKGDSDE